MDPITILKIGVISVILLCSIVIVPMAPFYQKAVFIHKLILYIMTLSVGGMASYIIYSVPV
jgi:hypothetical protein